MSDLDFQEFRTGFLAESRELLDDAGGYLLALDEALRAGRNDPRAVRELFRALHTVKGLASMVGIEPIVAIAHQLETILRQADRGHERLPVEAVDSLVAGVRAIEQRVRAIERDEDPDPPSEDLLDALAAITLIALPGSGRPCNLDLDETSLAKLTPTEREVLEQSSEQGQRALAVDFVPSAERAARGVDITSVREQVRQIAEIVRVLPISGKSSEGSPALLFRLLLLTTASDADIARVSEADRVWPLTRTRGPPLPELEEEPIAGATGSVRVAVARLDAVMDTLSSMVVVRFRLEREVERLREAGADVRELEVILREQRKQLRDLRSHVIRVRTVSLSDVLASLPLLVRGAARAAGKRVRLEVEGGRAEVDKAVADRLLPAVVHLVRNAVDHGIETPAERQARGKPEEGLIRVVCRERANSWIELSVSDDGGGIDTTAVAKSANAPPPTDDASLLELLARPGLSTRKVASTTSGRGLGMDIVRRVAEGQLGGELRLRNDRERGATFSLIVPIRLAILDVFAFTCGDQTFVVPVSVVSEIIEVDPLGVSVAPGAGIGRRLIQRRGRAMPLVSLSELFKIEGPEMPPKALVVHHDDRPWGFGVDRLLGQHEVVVRTLDHPLVRVTGVSGATDLGDGRPTLVLDLLALGRSLVEVEA